MNPFVVLILVLGSLCASSGTLLLKVGATGRTSLTAFVNVYIFAGLCLYAMGSGFWIYGMSRQSLTSVYPFTMLSFVIIYLIGIVVFGETPSRTGLIGVAIMLVGLFLVTRNPT